MCPLTGSGAKCNLIISSERSLNYRNSILLIAPLNSTAPSSAETMVAGELGIWRMDNYTSSLIESFNVYINVQWHKEHLHLVENGALDCFQTLKSVKTLLYMGMKHLCMFFPPQIEMCVSKTFNCQWWTVVWSANMLKTAVNEESF